MEPLVIDGLGPFGWLGDYPDSLSRSPAGFRHGVYLWTVEVDHQYVVHYVGTATADTFLGRLGDEHRGYESSYNRVYDKDRFAQAETYLLWGGNVRTVYRHVQMAKRDAFMVQRDELRRHIAGMQRLFRILLLPLDDARLSKRIEAKLALTLQLAGGRALAFLAECIRFEHRRDDEPIQRVRVQFPVPVLGLGATCDLDV